MSGVGGFIFNYAFLFRPYNIPPPSVVGEQCSPLRINSGWGGAVEKAPLPPKIRTFSTAPGSEELQPMCPSSSASPPSHLSGLTAGGWFCRGRIYASQPFAFKIRVACMCGGHICPTYRSVPLSSVGKPSSSVGFDPQGGGSNRADIPKVSDYRLY